MSKSQEHHGYWKEPTVTFPEELVELVYMKDDNGKGHTTYGNEIHMNFYINPTTSPNFK